MEVKLLKVLIFCLVIQAVHSKVKTLFCNSVDKEYGEFTKCQIKPISRTRNQVNVIWIQKRLADNVFVRLQFLKRANGWRPFLYNFKFNVCDFLKKKNNVVVKLTFAMIETHINFLNRQCPYMPNQEFRLEKWELDIDKLRVRFPIENGEYAIVLTYYNGDHEYMSVNGSLLYYNYREP